MAPPRESVFSIETYNRFVKLIRSRFSSIKNTIETYQNQVNPLSLAQLKTLSTCMREVEKKKEDFDAYIQLVISLTSENIDFDSVIQDEDEINDSYMFIVGQIQSLSELNHPTSSQNDSNMSTPSQNSQVRLPKINLPKFSGDLSHWLSFINLYDVTIHNNESLSNVTRFQYLLGSLEGEALNIIRSLTITPENYTVAYALLRDRYQNDRRLQILHLNKLLDLPNISKSNIQGVRQFVNLFKENTQALTALGHNVQDSNPLLVAVLLRKMDMGLRHKLESFRETCRESDVKSKHILPTSQDIIEFLTHECNNFEDAMSSQVSFVTDKQVSNRTKPNNLSGFVPKKNVAMPVSQPYQRPSLPSSCSKSPVQCFVCNKTDHNIYSCSVFQSKTPNERFQIVKEHNHCVSCLGNHNLKQCKSQSSCKICNKRHHTLLHFQPTSHNNMPMSIYSKTAPPEHVAQNTESTPVTLTSQPHSSIHSPQCTVLLGTLLVKLKTPEGNAHVFRALLDSGSMCDLMSEHAANVLGVRRSKSSIQLSGIHQSTTRTNGQTCVDIETLSGMPIAFQHPMLILNKLTANLPRVPVSIEVLKQAQSFALADPSFHEPGRIDIVLGAALYPQILTHEQHSLGQQMPFIIGTHFGYVVMGSAPVNHDLGPFSSSANSPLSNPSLCLHAISDLNLHDSIQKFWVQEEPPVASKKSRDEELCDKHFSETHTRDKDGRYVVRLPFKDGHPVLGSSKQAAEIRLNAMERKFVSNPRFSLLYHEFMDEYLELGHMSKCDETSIPQPHYFLPHHGILKESSSTTKLRTVFDASCKTSSGTSLNDILLTGRKLQTNVCDIILQFRKHNVVFCCDIKQMYRQIMIHPDDRKMQLILWRDNPGNPVSIFELNTVTYGVNSSPYLAIRTLHQLAEDEGKDFPEAANVLMNQTYVDDIITGANSEADALQLQAQLISLLKRGGFELRKWISNSPELLCNFPENYLEIPKFLKESKTPQFSVLGLQWSSTTDVFSYNLQIPSNVPVTKRLVLSTIAKLYDPCGFLTPFILLIKCFMQLLWTQGNNWDEPLPPKLTIKWEQILSDIQCLTDVSIPRSLHFPVSGTGNIQLHGFCDASESGYAAVLYFRNESQDHVSINFIIAKSKVTPLKRVTLPRLELCAAHLLAKLVAYCRDIFSDRVTDKNIYLWCDSTIVLTWLHTPSYQLKTYVGNRVAQTQELTPIESWRHVSSADNPADCASRGLLVSELKDHSLWWNGPAWLRSSSSDWPELAFNPLPLDSSMEVKTTPLPVLSISAVEKWSVLTKFSSWSKLLRVIALVLRFIHNCKSHDHHTGFITTEELRDARLKIFSCVQKEAFSEEISSITHNKRCSPRISQLNPFIDDLGLIRVGGRLKFTDLSFDAKHPILLPKNHNVTHILIDYFHLHHLHAGPQLVQSLIHQHVWILSARSIIRSRLHKCITCFKHRPTNHAPLMGELPASRVVPAKPFLSTGLDYGGPFTVKMANLRFVKHIKVYICVFICMVTKAVHIEVSTDLTTDSFLACLTRFISRRGICKDVYSDCGTNFVGASFELRRIIKSTITSSQSSEQIHNFASAHNIKFHFNPPAAPHQGGLWESAIKSTKHHLVRVLGNNILTLPEFITLTTRVEAMLNSRPLTPLSNDPSDLNALTPGHFLVGGPIVLLPEIDLTTTPSNRIKHWKLVQQYHQQIWRRWSKEYLHTLHQRTKWNVHQDNLKVGDLVLIHEPTPPLTWPLGRIVAVNPGKDGIVRVAQVKTASSIITRPVVKLFPLPID